MSQDVFQEWRNSKFVVAAYHLLVEPNIVVILTDIGYWAQHIDELVIWCIENGGVVSGMTVTFDTPEQLAWFTLRWT